MEKKQRSPRFDIALNVRLDLREEGILEGTLGNLNASGEGIMVRSSKGVRAGDTAILEIPMPVRMRTIRCKGEIVHCYQRDGAYEIGIRICDIDTRSEEDLKVFCNFLMPHTGSDTVNHLIQQGEKALDEASAVIARESMDGKLEAVIHELLSLKYHDALRSFEDALKVDRENEVAMEAFCHSLVRAIFHYEQAGLDRSAKNVKTEVVQYFTDSTLEIAESSPRIGESFLGIMREVLSE